MKSRLVALAILASTIGTAQAENWVKAGVGNVGDPDEAVAFVDTDSISHRSEFVRFRARWEWRNPGTWNGQRFTYTLTTQEVDCVKYLRFMVTSDNYDEAGTHVRSQVFPVNPRMPSPRSGTPGDVASRFVCFTQPVS